MSKKLKTFPIWPKTLPKNKIKQSNKFWPFFYCFSQILNVKGFFHIICIICFFFVCFVLFEWAPDPRSNYG